MNKEPEDILVYIIGSDIVITQKPVSSIKLNSNQAKQVSNAIVELSEVLLEEELTKLITK